jgi:hypothetical protein
MTINKKCALIMIRSDFLKRASSGGAGIVTLGLEYLMSNNPNVKA